MGKLKMQLTDREVKADQTKCIGQVIGPPHLMCTKLVNAINSHIQMDQLTLEAFQKNGGDVKSISKSHMAYPLVTLSAMKAVDNFCINICNGCISDSADQRRRKILKHWSDADYLKAFAQNQRLRSCVQLLKSQCMCIII